MTHDHLDEALKDLQAELNLTPSPEFAAKVRQRIEQTPERSWRSGWAWAGVAATCAVAVIAVSVWKGNGAVEVGGPFRAGEPAGAEAPAYTKGTVPADAGRPFRAGGPGGLRASSPRAATTAPTQLEVLVPPDQLIAIRRLMAAVRAGAAPNLPASPVLFDPDTGELIPLKPIEIPLITVDPLPGNPDGRSGGRENR